MDNLCVFCNKPELSKYNPKNVEYICSNCVSLLLSMEQQEIIQAYDQAVLKNNESQAWALNHFIIKENPENEQRKPESTKQKLRRHFARKRGLGTVRRQQRST